MGDLEIISNHTRLRSIFKEYEKLEKEFGDIIWSQIQNYLPSDFNKSLLELDNILANIKWNGATHRPVSLVRIKDDDYEGEIKDLYNQIKELHGLKIDGFEIEIQGYNLDMEETKHHQVNIRFIKSDETIEIRDFEVDITNETLNPVANTVVYLLEERS